MKILIAGLRKERGISQTDLAERTGISRPYLAQIENGSRNLSLKYQQKIAEELEVEPAALVDFNANDDDERLIQEAFATLTGEQRRFWIELAQSVLRSRDTPPKD